MYSMTVPEGSDLTQTHAMQEQKTARGNTSPNVFQQKQRDGETLASHAQLSNDVMFRIVDRALG